MHGRPGAGKIGLHSSHLLSVTQNQEVILSTQYSVLSTEYSNPQRPRTPGPKPGSGSKISSDHLAPRPRAQGDQGVQRQGLFEEAHRAVAERDVTATGVRAAVGSPALVLQVRQDGSRRL